MLGEGDTLCMYKVLTVQRRVSANLDVAAASSTHWHSEVGEASPEGAVTPVGLRIMQ